MTKILIGVFLGCVLMAVANGLAAEYEADAACDEMVDLIKTRTDGKIAYGATKQPITEHGYAYLSPLPKYIKRYENDEVICYNFHAPSAGGLSCHWKDSTEVKR